MQVRIGTTSLREARGWIAPGSSLPGGSLAATLRGGADYSGPIEIAADLSMRAHPAALSWVTRLPGLGNWSKDRLRRFRGRAAVAVSFKPIDHGLGQQTQARSGLEFLEMCERSGRSSVTLRKSVS